MTEQELEAGFGEAAYKWLKKHGVMETRVARYFFFAGATFGVQAVTTIEKEHFGEKTTDEKTTVPGV